MGHLQKAGKPECIKTCKTWLDDWRVTLCYIPNQKRGKPNASSHCTEDMSVCTDQWRQRRCAFCLGHLFWSGLKGTPEDSPTNSWTPKVMSPKREFSCTTCLCAFGCGSKIGTQIGTLRNQGLKSAVWWFNFDPYPFFV